MDITPRRRRALSTVLALVLAVESVSAVAAAAQVSAAQRDAGGHASTAGVTEPIAESASSAVARGLERSTAVAGAGVPDFRLAVAPSPMPVAPAGKPDRPDSAPMVAKVQQVTPVTPSPKATRASSASPASYSGRNHVWIPSLGINRSVAWFPCDRVRPPDNYLYRWGCAGANNVYLLGHAYSVFKPLHDAYVSHRLTVGMKAYYADAAGRVHVYAVRWWKVTPPTTSASWAWAAQSTPSMTLQTCVGAHSEYRLMVRLVEVRG